jgi:transcriptional regulator with XRE-family HTH domain
MGPAGERLLEERLRQMFAVAILQCRKNSDMSQESLAERSGLSTSYISLLERGQRNLTVLVAARIAEACEIRLSELVVLAESSEAAARNSG